jgi:hypothetical protein
MATLVECICSVDGVSFFLFPLLFSIHVISSWSWRLKNYIPSLVGTPPFLNLERIGIKVNSSLFHMQSKKSGSVAHIVSMFQAERFSIALYRFISAMVLIIYYCWLYIIVDEQGVLSGQQHPHTQAQQGCNTAAVWPCIYRAELEYHSEKIWLLSMNQFLLHLPFDLAINK